MVGAPDAAAQLVKVGQSEPVRAVDDDGVGIRDIEPALDDRCAEQNVRIAAHKFRHDILEFVLRHLPVTDQDACARHEVFDAVFEVSDGMHAVVQEVDLSAARHLALDRIADDALVITADDRLDRNAVRRRCFDRAHVARAEQGKVKRPWDRSG